MRALLISGGAARKSRDADLEAAEREVAEDDELQYALRWVVGPVVDAERAQRQADGRESDHDGRDHVRHVSASELGGAGIDDLVQAGELRGRGAYDGLSAVGRCEHFERP